MKADTNGSLSQMSMATAPQKKGPERRLVEPVPVSCLRDPREMERAELETYLQSTEYFPTKASLLEFARRYNVPVNARTQREEMIRLCVRMIYDIPASFAGLRAAPRAPAPSGAPEVETRKVLENFFVGSKPEEYANEVDKNIAANLLDGILHCHEAGLLLSQVRGADVELFQHALETLVPAPFSPDEAVFDRAAVWSLVAGDTALLRELIGLFDQDCPRLFFTMQQAVMIKRAQDIVAAARSLTGVVRHFAAGEVVRLLAVIEKLGEQGNFTLVPELMMQLAVALTLLQRALDDWRRELPTSESEHKN